MLAAGAQGNGEQHRARAREYRDEKAPMIIPATRREIGVSKRHRLPPYQWRAALIAELDQTPGGVYPRRPGRHDQRVIEGTYGFTIPEEHGLSLHTVGVLTSVSRMETRYRSGGRRGQIVMRADDLPLL